MRTKKEAAGGSNKVEVKLFIRAITLLSLSFFFFHLLLLLLHRNKVCPIPGESISNFEMYKHKVDTERAAIKYALGEFFSFPPLFFFFYATPAYTERLSFE